MDWKATIDNREKDFTPLYDRMDRDKELLILKKYQLRETNSNKPLADVQNITLNDAMVFFNRVTSNLMGANMQTVVEGEKLKGSETLFAEDFFKDIMLGANERIQPWDIPSLELYAIQQMCNRGRTAFRVCLRTENRKFIPDITLWDTRYVSYELDNWVCYKTKRSKAKILKDYNVDIKGKDAIVQDTFTDEKEIVLIDDKEAKNAKHPYGKIPVVIQVCPSGLFLADDDRLLHSGESILASNRELYHKKNELGSILLTLSRLSFLRGMQLETDQGASAEKPALPPYGERFAVPIDKGTRGYFSMPIEDVNNACRWLYSMLESALQKGSLPAVSYGSLSFPLSAVAITSLTEAEDSVYLPRMQGLALFYQRLYRMILEQYIDGNYNEELGRHGFRKNYPYGKLDGDFSITFKFFGISPKQNIANYSVAAAARPFVSDDTIRRDVIHLEDPDGEKNKKLLEMAEQTVPALALYKMAKAKVDAGEEIEAKLIAEQLGLSIENIKNGTLPEQKKPKEPLQEPLLPLTAGEGLRAGPTPQKESAELEVSQEAGE